MSAGDVWGIWAKAAQFPTTCLVMPPRNALRHGSFCAPMKGAQALRRLHCCALAVAGVGERELAISEISAPVLSAPASPELRETGLAASRGRRSASTPCRTKKRRAAVCRSNGEARASTPCQAKAQPSRRQPNVDGKQLAAVLRIKPLRHLHCCALPVFCLGGVGASGKRQRLSLSNATARTDVRLAVTR